MLKFLEHIPVLGTFVIKPVLIGESFAVDRVLDVVNGARLLLGL